MIITCVCGEKKFNLPDGAIPASGRMVKCGYCDKEWKQFPVNVKEPKVAKPVVTRPTVSRPVSAPIKTAKSKKKIIKKTSPVPYSKEYMQQKWGTSVQNYAVEKGLTKKEVKISKKRKSQKVTVSRNIEKPSFGFLNYTIVFTIISIFLVGILNFERSRLSRKFPLLEPYIDHFFESLEIFKILILDFFR